MKVYQYGALSKSICPALREQMMLGHRYYNALVEAENNRRKTAWGGEKPSPPPHNDCDCAECKKHWASVRKAVREAPLLDVKPLRTEYSAAGLFWGTYLKVEQAFAAAWKSTDVCSTVSFKSWRKGQLAAVQIQRSRTPESQFRLEKAPDQRKGRRARDGNGHHTLRLRIGSDDRKQPVFSGPVKLELHRRPEGVPTWVLIVTKWIADREVATVHVVCKDTPERNDLAPRGVVAVDVSWRQVPDGIRIAYRTDDLGMQDSLVLGDRWIEMGKRADRIRSHRDNLLNDLKDKFESLSRVRSCQGAARKIRKMQASGESITAEMEAWLKMDQHLWQYETGCRRRSHAHRRARLREWVRDLRRSYAEVIVKDSAHKKMKEEAKEKKELHRGARRQGHHAAPGETVEVLREVFGEVGMHMVNSKHTTNRCVKCGHVNNHGEETKIQCEQCGDALDRDSASTQNMLILWAAGECRQPTARKKTARFAKRHKKQEQGDNASPTA